LDIVINTDSMIPIYEQIAEEVKQKIIRGELRENDALPSVRVLSRQLKISALTVKKAYDYLDELGLTATVHGKGSYVKAPKRALLQEEQRREIEKDLDAVLQKARLYGVSAEELRRMLSILTEE